MTRTLKQAVCTKCGANYPQDASFCGFDCRNLTQQETDGKPGSTPKICTKCKRRYPASANFCGVDGTKLQIKELTFPAPEATGNGAGGTAATEPKAANNGEPEPLIGQVIDGKYRIDSVLAEGGMAVLYLAYHTVLERTVVVKVIHGSLASRPEVVERFMRECKFAARLNHPNVVAVYDFGITRDKQPYLVMEYIRGLPLATWLSKKGPPPLHIAKRIINEMCLGLEEAHSCGILHRDLKPDNVILQDKSERPDWVKIVDFGIAHMLGDEAPKKRLTAAGKIIGTLDYMSPEQLTDKPLDVRSDIYSLGVVAFEILTGQSPFGSEITDSASLAKRLTEKAPAPSSVRPELGANSPLDKIVQRCLELAPDKRFQSLAELRQSLATLL